MVEFVAAEISVYDRRGGCEILLSQHYGYAVENGPCSKLQLSWQKGKTWV
jgi:hypothetical protein